MQAHECLNYEYIQTLPVAEIGVGALLEPRQNIDNSVPPFSPARFLQMFMSDGAHMVVFNPSGPTYHYVDLSNYRQIVNRPPIDHPEVQDWIACTRCMYRDWYMHPTFGAFNPKMLDADTRMYASGPVDSESYFKNLKELATMLDEEGLSYESYFQPYIKPENSIFFQKIRVWYPEFQE